MNQSRVVSIQVPLQMVIPICCTVIWALVSMYFSVQQMTRDISDLQVTVKAGNTQASTISGEIALMKFRMDNIENALQRQGVPTTTTIPGGKK